MSFNSFQNTIEQLNNAKNLAAEADFQDTLNQINDTANEQTSLFGDIEKAGASVGGVVVAGKTLKSMYTKFKGIVDKNKKGKKDDTEEADEEADDDVGEKAQVNEPTEGSGIEMTGTTEELGTSVDAPAPTMGGGEAPGDTLAVAPDDLASERAGDFDEEPEETAVDAPEATMGGGEAPGDTLAVAPDDLASERAGDFADNLEGADEQIGDTLSRNIAGRFEGDTSGGLLERTDATTDIPEEATFEATEDIGQTGEEASSGLESILSSVRSAIGGATDTATSAISGATDAATSALSTASKTASSITDAAAEGGSEIASEVEETAGAAVSEIPVIGPILGLVLEGVGIATSVGGIAAGVIGTADAGSAQQTATTAAEKTLAQAKALPTDVAGKFAVSAQSALQQFN